MYNLDELDTVATATGIPVEFRGKQFTVRRSTIGDSFDDASRRGKGYADEAELKAHLRRRLFTTNREFDRFWKTVTSSYIGPDGAERAALSLSELMALAARLVSISEGTVKPSGAPDPKANGSATNS